MTLAETILAGIVVTVGSAAIIGGAAWLRRRWVARSSIRIVPKLTDEGQPIPGFITWRVGWVLDLHVYPLTETPTLVREAGLELADGTRLAFGTSRNMNIAVTRPNHIEASNYLDSIREQVSTSGSPVRAFYAVVAPDRVFRVNLPRGWEGFPDKLPDRLD